MRAYLFAYAVIGAAIGIAIAPTVNRISARTACVDVALVYAQQGADAQWALTDCVTNYVD